jgi:thioredoxin reductase (NADPH)
MIKMNYKNILLFCFVSAVLFLPFSFSFAAPPSARVKDIAHVLEARDNQLIGFGLVAGLKNTGDSIQTEFTKQALTNLLSRMGIAPGEKEFKNKGLTYCATCDGPLFRAKDVVVVGGGDTALEDAMYLTRFVNGVTIVHRRDRLRAASILQERALANAKIKFKLNSTATAIIGEKTVTAVKIKDTVTNSEDLIKCSGVFIFIGTIPNSDIVKGIVKLDDRGYIASDDDMCTSMDGIFACGDVRKKTLRQVVTAVGEGATAAFSAQHYVERLKGVEYK